MKLTGNEDDFLKQGREIFGFVQWTAILGELNNKFQEGSTVDSLKKRAELKMLRAHQSNSECNQKWSLFPKYFRRLSFNVSREVKSFLPENERITCFKQRRKFNERDYSFTEIISLILLLKEGFHSI